MDNKKLESKPNKKFDLNLLRVFISTYETESVTKSAEQLDLTQSAVSNALTRLKENVGKELFSRTGRGIKPTRYAKELYEQTHDHIMSIEKVIQGLEAFDPKKTQRTFVVYCHEAAMLRLQKRLHVCTTYPNIEIILKELPPKDARIYEDLQMEKVDLVIDVSPSDSKVFQSELLHSEGLRCVASKDHPRLRQGKLDKSSYMAESHVLLNIRRHNLTFVEWLVSEVLPPRKVFSQHSSLLGMLPSVSNSQAIAVIPQSVAEQYGDVFQLQTFPFPFETKTFDSYMVWPSKMSHNSAITWLRQQMVHHLKES
ncbi:LysR family transcriptional regulator [Vibrio barjaei]|uniref:LysR family transcriptional regulator n=2 Tax=Vibrio TaxID=662 RepID=UPI0022846EE3|nr:LysR family transcriptional regulator [Vibrio barjaei]MCY9872442.1 LysR family transcriptional regulator [Vibrio barjaei]